MLVPIGLVTFVQGFVPTFGTVVVGLVISRVTDLKHEGLDILPPTIVTTVS